MAYTISYTDVANKGTITIEDGSLNTDTSLRIPGRNSTAYGAVIAENFLHLLENFSSTIQPSNPVEGQLWYDNTLGQETLKVYNGTNWVPASGITKSINTPALAQTGDLWVDTDNQQLYLFTGGGWILVGPSFSEGLSTGARADQIVGQDNNLYNILRIEVSGTTIGILSGADNTFIPKATIAGFPQINPGFNLINRDTDSDGQSNFKFFGTAEKAENLIVSNESIPAGNFLRGDTTSTTNSPINVQNNQGINYGINGELTIGVEGQAGIIQHNVGGSNIDVRIRNENITRTVIRVDSNLRVGINTEAPDQALDVVGTIQASGDALINGDTQSSTINNGALVVRGGAAIKRNLNVGEDTQISGLLTTSNIVPDAENVRTIGSDGLPYSAVHANTFYGVFEGNVTGTLTGRSTESDKLTSRTTFIMEGDITTLSPVEYDGQFQDPNFDNGEQVIRDDNGEIIERIPLPRGEQPLQKKFITRVSNSIITDRLSINDAIGQDELLINQALGNTPGLKRISKADFLKGIPRTPTGLISPFAGDITPPGWVLCDGRELDQLAYEALFKVIGFKYGLERDVTRGFFKVPDLRGRLPLGMDDMNSAAGAANVVTSSAADVLGGIDGTETKLIDVTNLPQHKHNLEDTDGNQFYAIQDRQDPTTDVFVSDIDAPTATQRGQALNNSGEIVSQNPVGQPFNVMPPTLTLNYIIYDGRQ